MPIVGSQFSHRHTFRNAAGTATEPDAVVAVTRNPAGVNADIPAGGIVSGGTGIRDVTFALATIGTWYLEITGTGANIVDEVIEVRACSVASSVA